MSNLLSFPLKWITDQNRRFVDILTYVFLSPENNLSASS